MMMPPNFQVTEDKSMNSIRLPYSPAKFCTAIVCLWAAAFGFHAGGRLEAAERPNIIFMMSDDQGWNGTSVQMHPDLKESRGSVYHTPNLERLAAEGMRFSAGYSPAPVCSPTRISIQTGKSPAQLHWTKAAPPE